MNSKTFNEIIQLNKDFYKKIGPEFSRTRQHPWENWKEVLKAVNKHFIGRKSIKVLDLACGNGRFYKFFKANYKDGDFKYLGLDTDDFLLSECKTNFKDKNTVFKKHDVILDIDKIKGKFDLVTAFGITHHIPSKKYREYWFKCVENLTDEEGMIVISFWDFLESKKSKITKYPGGEEGDYLMSWGNTNAKRYAHYFGEGDMEMERKGYLVYEGTYVYSYSI